MKNQVKRWMVYIVHYGSRKYKFYARLDFNEQLIKKCDNLSQYYPWLQVQQEDSWCYIFLPQKKTNLIAFGTFFQVIYRVTHEARFVSLHTYAKIKNIMQMFCLKFMHTWTMVACMMTTPACTSHIKNRHNRLSST